MVARWSFFALVLLGCIREPELATCAEFPFDANEAICGEPCDIYCAELLATCGHLISAENPEAACQAACSEFVEAGEFGATEGNSAACRITQALQARRNPELCAGALFDGGSVCVNTPCDTYCLQMETSCPEMFQSRSQCKAACQLYPTGGDPSGGNSLECRLSQLAAGNCEEAGITGREVCGTACEGYCTQAVPTCAGRTPFLNDEASCLTLCDLMAVGSYSDWINENDSVQCRAWHAGGPAQLDPDSHCAHAALYNDQHCGNTCSTWCSLCLDQFGGDFEACVPDCQARVAAGEALFPDPAARLQCR